MTNREQHNAYNRELRQRKRDEGRALVAAVLGKKKAQYARTCLACNKPFVTDQPLKMCCGKNCADRHWRRNNPESVRLITEKKVREEEQKQLPTIALIARPTSGPRCECCNAVLYFYERGKCLRCSRAAIIRRREEKVLIAELLKP